MTTKNQKPKSISLCVFAPLRLCVKNLLLVFTFIILFSLGAFAQSDANQSNETLVMPADFESDGCSLFPDFDYRDCCVEHDKTVLFRRKLDKTVACRQKIVQMCSGEKRLSAQTPRARDVGRCQSFRRAVASDSVSLGIR